MSSSNARDITPVVLSGAPLIDGRADEWDTDSRNLIRVAGPGGDGLRLLAATHERWLYLALLVRDDKLVFDASMLRPLDSENIGDRIWLAFDDKRGGQQQLFFGSTGAGALRGRRIETREYGREEAVEEPRIESVWQRSRDGYVVEIGIPLSLVGQHIGVLIDDRDRRGATRASYGTLDVADLRATGRLIAASPDLSDHLRQFAQPGVELTVASSTGAILTRLDAPALPADYTRMRGFLPRMYRLFLDGDAIPRSVSQAERQRAAEALTDACGARQTRNRAVRGPLRKQRDRRRGGAHLLGRRQADLRRHPARADGRSLAHAARSRAHAAAEPHAVRHAVRGGGGVLVRRPHDAAHLAARRRQRNRARPRGQPLARAARSPTPATSSAICRAASLRCSAASMNTPATCARWPASWPTRSARR